MELTPNQIIRNIKMHELSGIELDKNLKHIHKVLKSDFSNLNRYKVHDKGDFIFFGNSKTDIKFVYNKQTKIAFIDYFTYSKFNLDIHIIEDLLEIYLSSLFDNYTIVMHSKLYFQNSLETFFSFGYNVEKAYQI